MGVRLIVVIALSRHRRHLFAAYRPYHDHYLWWFLAVIVLLAFLILTVGALLVAGRPRQRSEIEQPLIPPSPPSEAEQILAERLARGEIEADEYRRRRDTLRE